MRLVLGVFESAVLIALSLIHFYWAFGGTWGFEKALPTNKNGERVLHPKPKDSAIVGVGLLSFGMFYLVKIKLLWIPLYPWMLHYLGWFILAVFTLRAIGDFRYIGFFKRIKNTEFGELDSKYYTPLCLIISLIALLLQLLS